MSTITADTKINKDYIRAGDYIEAEFHETIEGYRDGLPDWEFEPLYCEGDRPEREPIFGGDTYTIMGRVKQSGDFLQIGGYALHSERLVILKHEPVGIDVSKIKIGDTVTIRRSIYAEKQPGELITGTAEEGTPKLGFPLTVKDFLLPHKFNPVVAHTPADLTPEPVPEIDLGYEAKIIDLEAQLARAQEWAHEQNRAYVQMRDRCEELSIQVTNAKLDNELLGEKLMDAEESLEVRGAYLTTLERWHDTQAETIRTQREIGERLKEELKVARGLAEDYNAEADRLSKHAIEQRDALVERIRQTEERRDWAVSRLNSTNDLLIERDAEVATLKAELKDAQEANGFASQTISEQEVEINRLKGVIESSIAQIKGDKEWYRNLSDHDLHDSYDNGWLRGMSHALEVINWAAK